MKITVPAVLSLASLALAACAGNTSTGPLQPQAVNGACQVKPFFLVALSATPVSMRVDDAGQACSFSIINPNLQIIQSAALVTSPAAHGRADAGLVSGGASAVVSYRPAPGYSGPDRFTVTIEPADKTLDVTVNVAR
jgi:hypothetical protein